MVHFWLGAMTRSPAETASLTLPARMSASVAEAEVSAADSAVQASDTTWPGGVIEARSNWVPGRIGPFSDHCSSIVTGWASFTLMMEARVRSGL